MYEGWHTHENTHLTLIVAGGITEQRRNGTSEAVPGTLLFYYAGEKHRNENTQHPLKNINLVLEPCFYAAYGNPVNVVVKIGKKQTAYGTTGLEFRTRNGVTTVSKTLPWLTQRKYDKPLFILTNRSTFSAAEAFTYSLQATKRAKVVGQPSGGGAYMNSWYPVNEHIFFSVSTGAPTLPCTEQSWQGKGVQPDHVTEAGKEIERVKLLLTEAADAAHK